MPPERVLGMDFLQQILYDLFLGAFRRTVDPVADVLQLVTFVNQKCGITTIVHDQLKAFAIRMSQCLLSTPPVFLERLAFPGKH